MFSTGALYAAREASETLKCTCGGRMGGNTPLLNSVELEDFQGDPDVQETIDLKEKYKKKLKSALMQCDDSIRRMKELADATNESFYKAHAAKTAGNVTSAVGGGICIGVATVLIPFTAGISAIAIIPGAILGGVGGVVSAGAEIGHIVVRNEKKKAAEQQLLLEKDKLEEIQQLGEELKKQVDGLVKKYPNIKQHLIIQHVMEPVTVGKGLYRGVDGAIDVGRVVLLPLKTALGKVFLALEVVALPLDLAFMGYSAFKVHNYRQGKRISDVAKKLDEVINQLEDTKFEIEEQLNEML